MVFLASVRQMCLGLLAAVLLCAGAAVLPPPVFAASSWSPPVVLSGVFSAAAGPQIAVEPDGEAVAIWSLSKPGSIFTATRPAGGVWSAPVAIPSSSGEVEAPEIAVGANGDAVAAWQLQSGARKLVLAATRTVRGGWSAPVTLSAADQDAVEPAVAINDAGDAVVIWSRLNNGVRYLLQGASRPAGGTWGPTQNISRAGANAIEGEVAIAADGDAVSVWRQEAAAGVWVVQANDRPAGTKWRATQITLSESGVREPPALALNRAGDAVVVWRRDSTLGRRIEAASRPTGAASWEAPMAIAAGDPALDADVAIDDAGEAVAVWANWVDTNVQIQAASRPAGGSWGAPTYISARTPTSVDRDPQIALDADGSAVAVWHREDYDADTVQAATRPADGAWSPAADLSVHLGDVRRPNVGVGDGRAIALWWRSGRVESSALEAAEPGPHQLVLEKTGVGQVSSTPAGIDCGGTCTASFDDGSVVTLSAPAGAEAVWSGCNAIVGANECQVTINSDRSVRLSLGGIACAGADVVGAGSALQGIPHQQAWLPVFAGEVCAGGPSIGYTPVPGEAGMLAWNADGTRGSLDTAVAFIGIEEAPTAAQIANIESKAGGGRLAVIPVAQTAISLIATPPAGCSVEEIGNSELAGVMEGRIREWSKLEFSAGGAACEAPIVRVVRSDSAGTTRQFKHYLFQLNKAALPCTSGLAIPGEKATWLDLESGAANVSWPESCPEKALSELRSTNGGEGLAAEVIASEGAIGFVALPEAKAALAKASGGDSLVLALQNNAQKKGAEAHFAAPELAGAANCATMTYQVPKLNEALSVDWSASFGSKPNIGAGYPLCQLTYALALDGYEKAGFDPDAGATVAEYLGGYVLQPAGQAALVGEYFTPLPSSSQNQLDVLGAARSAAAEIG